MSLVLVHPSLAAFEVHYYYIYWELSRNSASSLIFSANWVCALSHNCGPLRRRRSERPTDYSQNFVSSSSQFVCRVWCCTAVFNHNNNIVVGLLVWHKKLQWCINSDRYIYKRCRCCDHLTKCVSVKKGKTNRYWKEFANIFFCFCLHMGMSGMDMVYYLCLT